MHFIPFFFALLSAVTASPVANTSRHWQSRNTQLQTRETYSGGVATFFYQQGVAGACGKVHSDSDLICAMDQQRYGNPGAVSSLCGKKVKITNTKNKKTVTVTVADDCPTCENENSIDLSEGAFTAIATKEEGEVPITWEYAS